MNKLMKKKGFTLIELIAVIAILAVLAAIAVPRVIKYVEKSKKVAIQTEAATIYNAAEAAYNDGRLKGGDKKFDAITVTEAVNALKEQELLSGETNIKKIEKASNLGGLKKIMNADVSNIKVDGEGDFQEILADTQTGKK